MKSNLASFEVTCLVKELQFLVGGKIEKIFQTSKPKEDFLFSIHIPSTGKRFLFISLPNFFCLSSFKPSFPDVPPHFCSSLRRKITGARITSIEQVDFERIIKIGFSTKNGVSDLIVELLPPGNMVLVLPEEENKIIAVLHPKIWNEHRKILPNRTYTYPPKQLDPRTLSCDDFFNTLNSSDKESLVKSLAIDFSLGGLYAKEVLFSIDVDHNIIPKDISRAISDNVFNSLNDLFNRELSPFITEGVALPFDTKELSFNEKSESFNSAIASIALSSLEKAEVKEHNKSSNDKLSKTQKVIKAQSRNLEKLKHTTDEKKRIGELIYANYSEINNILVSIQNLRKTNSWSEIKEKVKDHPFKINIDEHKGILTLEVDD